MTLGYKKIISITLSLFISICFSITDTNLSGRINIDGLSNDFDDDEKILSDSDGNLLESPSDSYWGKNNDIKQIKVTWDLQYLYLAVDACSYGNNVLLFIDIYDDYGIEDMSELKDIYDTDTWHRSFKFYNFKPDFFVATWDTNDTPQFWRVEEGSSNRVEQIFTIETFSTFDSDNLSGSMEVKIPFDMLFDEEHPKKIKLLSTITGSDEYTSGPDCAPDNLGGMANDEWQMVILDNYAEVFIDEDEDGSPDMGIEPQMQTTFLEWPPIKPEPLLVQNVIFENGKIFSPLLDQAVFFQLDTNRSSEFRVEIFDLNGKFVNFAQETNESLNWMWNGRNEDEDIVPFGVYILCFIADSNEISHNEAVVVIK